MPVLWIWILTHKLEVIKTEKFQQKWQPLFEEINDKTKWQIAFYFVFIIGRIWFIYVVFYLDTFPIF